MSHVADQVLSIRPGSAGASTDIGGESPAEIHAALYKGEVFVYIALIESTADLP